MSIQWRCVADRWRGMAVLILCRYFDLESGVWQAVCCEVACIPLCCVA